MAVNQLRSPLDALKFVVEFAQINLQEVPAKRLPAIDLQVQRFINRETPGHWHTAAPDPALLRELQSRAFSLFRDLLTVTPRQSLAIAGDLLLTFFAVSDDTGRVRVIVNGTAVARFLHQIIRVLEATGFDRLFVCPAPGCGRFFVKVTKKTYCSTRCQSRVYMRQYRKDFYGKTTRPK